jgi:hypothetical protein
MNNALKVGLQAIAYAAFAAFIGYFSTFPRYQHLQPDEALLRLSFKHPGKPAGDCRERTPEELAKLPPQLRNKTECPRERSPVRAVVELDGKPLYDEIFPAAGLKRDGAASGYRRLAIPAGRHTLKVAFNDDARAQGFTYEHAATVDLKPGQVVLIDLVAERGGVVIR